MTNDFKKRKSELLNFNDLNGVMGLQHISRFYTKAGVSSLYSEVGFLTQVKEEEIQDVPDYVLSDTLQADLETSVWVCLHQLKETKYIPENAHFSTRFGAVPEGEREGVNGEHWMDFEVTDHNGASLYTSDELSAIASDGQDVLGHVLWLIAKDICEAGGFLSPDWYKARIGCEYFKSYPVSKNSAYLIGELFKELCAKEQFEGDLVSYYHDLERDSSKRAKGTLATKNKAEELRIYAVELFVELANDIGPRLLMAPDDYKADSLRKEALSRRPNDFQRAGKPYGKEWFLRNVIEDRKIDIVKALEAAIGTKG